MNKYELDLASALILRESQIRSWIRAFEEKKKRGVGAEYLVNYLDAIKFLMTHQESKMIDTVLLLLKPMLKSVETRLEELMVNVPSLQDPVSFENSFKIENEIDTLLKGQ